MIKAAAVAAWLGRNPAWFIFWLLIMLALLVSRGWPLWFPTVVETARTAPACDLRHGMCQAAFTSGGSVQLALAPRDLPLLRPLQIRVTVHGRPPPQRVEVDFVGVDMNMGFNRFALTPTAPLVYEGTGMLPVCTRQRMAWEARVLLHDRDGLRAAVFGFLTYR